MDKNLRERAEEQLAKQARIQDDLLLTSLDGFALEGLKNVHELQVFQIELEMQNEELQQSYMHEKELQERYAEIYEFAPSSFFSLSRDGTIQLANRRGINLLGFEKENLLKCRFGVFVAEEDKPTFNHFLEQAFITSSKQSCVLIIEREGSLSVTVQMDGKLSADQKECRIVMHDITERKLAEEALNEQRVKLVSYAKFAALGEMAGGIAHEINNPLTVIMTKIFLIQDQLEQNSINIPEINSELKGIESTIDRISKIIKGLKSFSRNSENDLMVVVNLAQIVEDSLGLCREKLKYQNIELIFEKYIDVDLKCKASALSQVMLNLISNSMDAIEHLETKWIKIEITNSNPNYNVSIKITDSGSGIQKEIVQQMMEPFFTTKEVGKGTGLGLSISKGIIEEMKGQLRYELNSGHTCFVIELPIQ